MTQGHPNKRQPKPPDLRLYEVLGQVSKQYAYIDLWQAGRRICLMDPKQAKKLHNWLTRAIKYLEQNQ